MFTVNGTHVSAEEGCPTLGEVAHHLALIPRWVGATNRRWSVLDHTMAVHQLTDPELIHKINWERTIQNGMAYHDPPWLPKQYEPLVPLWALWHDASEVITGDIPIVVKTPEQTRLQEDLDRRLWVTILDLPFPPTDHTRRIVHWIDQNVAIAEANLLLHSLAREKFSKPDPVVMDIVRDGFKNRATSCFAS